MTILAKTNGWLIVGDVIDESDTAFYFKPRDSKNIEQIKKDSKTNKLFEDAYLAVDWIEENNK